MFFMFYLPMSEDMLACTCVHADHAAPPHAAPVFLCEAHHVAHPSLELDTTSAAADLQFYRAAGLWRLLHTPPTPLRGSFAYRAMIC